MTTLTDQQARDAASRALSAIEAHQQVCAERQGHIIQGLAELKQDVKGLFLRFWLAAISLITILLSVCGSLVYLLLNKGN
jgi:hypothetical protein